MMAEAVYILCAVTSIVCAFLLLRGYRASRTRLLFWASLCFIGLAIDNVLLFADVVVLPQIDLFWYRTSFGLAAMLVFLCGLIWESR
ncbi:MAG: DUF5985 family protein [Steroidobacteraceae bacterium]